MAAFHSILDELLHTVLDSLFLLVMSLSSIHAAGGFGRIAAGIGHLLEKNYIFACLFGIDGCRHTCAACADNDDIRFQLFLLFLCDRLFLFIREGIHVRTGSPHGLFSCAEDCVAGDGRAAQSIHLGTLCFHDAVIEHFHCEGTDIFSFIITFDLHVFNCVFRNFQSYGHIAAEALGCLGVGSGNKQITFRSLGTC